VIKDPATQQLIAATQKAIEQSRHELEHFKQRQIESQKVVEQSEKLLRDLVADLGALEASTESTEN